MEELTIPIGFFDDMPVNGKSTTGLPQKSIDRWVYFDEDGYIKVDPFQESPRGLHLNIDVTLMGERGGTSSSSSMR